jgi:hypothetical protein
MSAQGWQEVLVASQVDGTQILNNLTQASVIPLAAVYTLPAGFFSVPGKEIKITAKGRISCVATTPGTLTWSVIFGAAPSTVFNNGAAALNLNASGSAKTDLTWWLEIELTCRSIGSAATLLGIGQFTSEAVVGSPLSTAGGSGSLFIPASAPAVGATFNSTLAQTVDLQAKFSVATATTALTCHQYKLISLN